MITVYMNTLDIVNTLEILNRLYKEGHRGCCVVYPLDNQTIGTIHYYSFYDHFIRGWACNRRGAPAIIDLKHDIVQFVIAGERFTDTVEFCEKSNMSQEETFLWVLKYGETLPTTCQEFYGNGYTHIGLADC